MTVVAPAGRKLLRIEARLAETPIERKPAWIKTRMRTGPSKGRCSSTSTCAPGTMPSAPR